MKKILYIVFCILLIVALTNCGGEKEEQRYNIVLYVSKYDKIHSYPNCSGMLYYTFMPLSAAIEEGYTVCHNCKGDICQAIYDYTMYQDEK